jgi:arylsulfatase A-like enzyme
MHALQGVFMAYGPDIKKSGEKLPNLKIYDVTPTVLHMFGLPVVKDMDGRVLTEIFNEGSEQGQKQVIYREVDYEVERIKARVRQLRKLRKL